MSPVAHPYRLRPGTLDDAETMHATVAAGFLTYREFAPAGWQPPVDIGPDAVRARLERGGTWALMGETLDRQPAGHVAFTPATESRWSDPDPKLVHLWQLFVLQPYWGTGLGPRLLERSRTEAIRQGYTTMRLYPPAGQARARRFYEREGFSLGSKPVLEGQLGLEVVEYRATL